MTTCVPLTAGFTAAISLSKSSALIFPRLVGSFLASSIFLVSRSDKAVAESASLHWIVQLPETFGAEFMLTDIHVTLSHCGSLNGGFGGAPPFPPPIFELTIAPNNGLFFKVAGVRTR